MNFSEFNIDESDYKFFKSLPKDEKLLFLYDLICENAYGIGSVEVEDSIPIDSEVIEDETELHITDPSDKFRNFIASSINELIDVNVIILNDKLILNSNSEEKLLASIKDMFNDGVILYKYNMSENARYVFQHQKFCKIYVMAGKCQPICSN